MKRQRGFTIIELLIVVGIIGVIAAIAIPNLIDAVNRARQKRTMSDMRSIATAWEARATDMHRYNAAGALDMIDKCNEAVSHGELTNVLTPTYMKSIPAHDGWRNPYRFASSFRIGDPSPATEYLIWAAGRDASFTAQSTDPGGATTNFNADILFSHGVFVQYPEGIQIP